MKTRSKRKWTHKSGTASTRDLADALKEILDR